MHDLTTDAQALTQILKEISRLVDGQKEKVTNPIPISQCVTEILDYFHHLKIRDKCAIDLGYAFLEYDPENNAVTITHKDR